MMPKTWRMKTRRRLQRLLSWLRQQARPTARPRTPATPAPPVVAPAAPWTPPAQWEKHPDPSAAAKGWFWSNPQKGGDNSVKNEKQIRASRRDFQEQVSSATSWGCSPGWPVPDFYHDGVSGRERAAAAATFGLHLAPAVVRYRDAPDCSRNNTPPIVCGSIAPVGAAGRLLSRPEAIATAEDGPGSLRDDRREHRV